MNCTLCEKTLSSVKTLKRHHQNYHALICTTYNCLECPIEFIRRDTAKRHIRKIHPDCTTEPGSKIVLFDTTIKKPTPWKAPQEATLKNPTFKIIPAPQVAKVPQYITAITGWNSQREYNNYR